MDLVFKIFKLRLRSHSNAKGAFRLSLKYTYKMMYAEMQESIIYIYVSCV